MFCPFCNTEETKVIDSRLVDGNKIRRRRECPACNGRFTTYEVAELAMPWIIKRNGRRDVFDEAKLRGGMLRALEKRPVSADEIDAAVGCIMQRLRASGEREIQSKTVGEWVMEELQKLDEVAYVRFASVYLSFQDVQAFEKEIERMQKKSTSEKS